MEAKGPTPTRSTINLILKHTKNVEKCLSVYSSTKKKWQT